MSDENVIPVLVVFGATASGKTALARDFFAKNLHADSSQSLGLRFRGRAEIISADSMQVYRGMDIGTAKPDPVLLQNLPHHLINICTPDEQFCAGDFVRLADTACRDIYSRGKLPVILGGTAFYIRNFLFGLPETPASDANIRTELLSRMKKEGASILMQELAAADPVSAARISIHDEYRIVRALEVLASSGRPLSSFTLSKSYRPGYRFLVISLDRPRTELYDRINRRVVRMFTDGLVNEVAGLIAAGYTADDPGMQAIGYREFFLFDSAEDPAIRERIQLDSRKYAKRQATFIRALSEVAHVYAEDYRSIAALLDSFLASKRPS